MSDILVIDDPAPRVLRLAEPAREAQHDQQRGEYAGPALYDKLHAADRDPAVGVSIIAARAAVLVRVKPPIEPR